jgi:hypothetical protein
VPPLHHPWSEASRNDHFWARQLLGKLDRDLVKPATMTTPYGVSRGTIYKELLDTDAIKSCINPPECARYLARVLEECIAEVAIEAGKIMDCLRQVMASGNRKKYARRLRVPRTPSGKTMINGRSTGGNRWTASSRTSSIPWTRRT